MENRRQSRHAATRVAAAVAQEAICTLMSSSADKEFESSLQSYSTSIALTKSSRSATKRDAHGIHVDVKTESGGKCDSHRNGSSTHDITSLGNRSQSGALLSPKRESMFDAYQVWALKTYGDSAKTKTVTKKKYNRIMKILKGEESTNVENSKFRFWVKAKGFRIGPNRKESINDEPSSKMTEHELYVPCSKSTGSERDETVYKRVAVVENFYDIIYNVHVEMDGRSGKHAGQKRTYKAVAEMYAFLPREAVTRFLMSCSDCQKRMHLQGTNGSCNSITTSNSKSTTRTTSAGRSPVRSQHAPSSVGSPNGGPKTTLDIDYSLPLTTTIKRMRNAGFVYNMMGDPLIAPNCIDGQDFDEEMISETGASEADNNGDHGAGNSDEALCEEITADVGDDDDEDDEEEEEVADDGEYDEDAVPLDMSRVKCENSVCFEQPLNMCSKRAKLSGGGTKIISSGGGTNSLCNGTISNNYHERWTHNGIPKTTNDEDDDDDDDDNDLQMGDRMLIDHSGSYDPERLKAFNMFVRLFVDENLDRLVPISRQPKEKIQAIIESCARQFPEFGERSRKRIRTYLKSCRRTKRHKSSAGNENTRGWNESSNNVKSPASNHVYHLTSPMAEQILATACDNECQNAKRMRMGLKPLSVNLNESSNGSCNTASSNTPNCTNPTSTSASAVQVFQQNTSNTNSNLLSFPYQNQQCIATENGGTMANGTSSSIHGTANTKSTNGNHYSLNPSEVAAVKQLIAGYRESAAFLLRSADELEQLILQQN